MATRYRALNGLSRSQPAGVVPRIHEATVLRVVSLAFGEGDVVQIEITTPWPEPFYDAAQVIVPHATEPLGEYTRIDRQYFRPVRLEIAQPVFRGVLVVPAQFLNFDDMQTVAVQQFQCAWQAWDAAAREHILDREEFRGEPFNVAGGRDHADAARLQCGRNAFDPERLTGKTGMFIDAD